MRSITPKFGAIQYIDATYVQKESRAIATLQLTEDDTKLSPTYRDPKTNEKSNLGDTFRLTVKNGTIYGQKVIANAPADAPPQPWVKIRKKANRDFLVQAAILRADMDSERLDERQFARTNALRGLGALGAAVKSVLTKQYIAQHPQIEAAFLRAFKNPSRERSFSVG